MRKEYFVDKDSVVRQIWGKADTILMIFAGAAAEFALNKAVDWLYFTGRLPSDPLGRLFSTVNYARTIVFSEKQTALQSIKHINEIHASIEDKRGTDIPEWAYRDVLFMLIDYSIRAFELMERPLTAPERQEVLDVFIRVGQGMDLKSLPEEFESFQKMRHSHLQRDLMYGEFSEDLFGQYRKHLGKVRYRLLLETQILIVPMKVKQLLHLRSHSHLKPLILIYKIFRALKMDWLLKEIILPSTYKKEIQHLDKVPE